MALVFLWPRVSLSGHPGTCRVRMLNPGREDQAPAGVLAPASPPPGLLLTCLRRWGQSGFITELLYRFLGQASPACPTHTARGTWLNRSGFHPDQVRSASWPRLGGGGP